MIVPTTEVASVRTATGVLAVALLAGELLLAISGLRPATPAPASSPTTAFSAERAMEALATALAGVGPHPVGSEAAAAFRELLAAHLTAIGLPPRHHIAWTCAPRFAACAPVTNLVVTLPGRETAPAVVLVAHTDSVPAGPGAADDGAGLAVLLEVARALKASPPLARPVRVVLTDGEEAGLLGAREFVDSDPEAAGTFAVVNIDNRGTGGPSLMFETGADNAQVVEAYARAVNRPHASSLFVEIYRRLPNDTDFTVFRRARLPGLNFAFVAGSSRYHTPLDDLSHLDPRSVQDHGDAVLATVRALAEAPRFEGAGDAVYGDLFGRTLVHWPASVGPVLAGVALALVLAGLLASADDRAARLAQAVFGLVAWVLALVLGLGLAVSLARIVSAVTGDPTPWRAAPFALRLGVWSSAFSGALAAASWLRRRAGSWGLVGGAWLGWAGLSVVLAVRLPGASVVLLLPSLLAGAVLLGAGLAGRGTTGRGFVAAAVGASLAGGVMGFPLALLGEQALGFSLLGSGFIAVALLIPATSIAPLLTALKGRRLVLGVAAAGVLLGGIGATLVPRASTEDPKHLNLLYVEDTANGAASWIASGGAATERGLPPGLAAAADFSLTRTRVLPWQGPTAPVLAAPAPALDLPAARLELVEAVSTESGGRRLRMRLDAPASLPNVTLMVPSDAGPRSLLAGGADAGSGRRRGSGPGMVRWELVAVPGAGLELELELATGGPAELTLVARRSGLPEEGAPLQAARGRRWVPANRGDETLSVSRVRL